MLKIAICEDNSIHCKQIHDLTCSCLQAAYDVDIYTSADDFLARITDQKCPYQIVLMDIELDSGDMSGIHLAEKINLSNSGTQIIFISQYLQYASAVYETNHVYFVSKQQMEEYLPRALSAACRKLSELHRQYFCFSYHSPFRYTVYGTQTAKYRNTYKISDLLLSRQNSGSYRTTTA